MNFYEKNIFKALAAGLPLSQILSTLYVWRSDLNLYQSLIAVKSAGYLPIPNEIVMPSLQSIVPAFYGGLFFTLSIGAALSLFSLAVLTIWDRILKQDQRSLIFIGIFWAGMIILANIRGFCPIATSFFILIPATIIFSMRNSLSKQSDISGSSQKINPMMIHISLIILIIGIGASRMNINVFLNFRDNFLLSNPVGLQINNFYYNYTLYAAEVFKSPAQKQIRTCRLSFEDKSLKEQIEKQLLYYDYISIDADILVDLEMTQQDAGDFLKNPSQYLKNHSQKHDRYAFFRSCVMISIFGLPFVMLYACIYGLYSMIIVVFRRYPRSTVITASAILMIAISVVLFYQKDRTEILTDFEKELRSDNWEERFFALKTAAIKHIDIADYDVSKIIASPHILERYWLVRAYGQNNSPKIFDNMMRLLDDPQLNVAYTMYAALGKKGDLRAIPEILKRIRVSDKWYVQLYAYQSLRRLGWVQSKSK